MKTLTMSVRLLNEHEIVKHTSDKGLAIILKDEEGKEISVEDYMYSFRGYSFQIGGLGGNGSSYNSTVVGFGNIIKAMLASQNMERSNSTIYSSNVRLTNDEGGNSIIAELINGQAMICINKMLRSINSAERFKDVKIVLSKDIGDCDELWNRETKNHEDHPWRKMILDTVKHITELVG